MEKYRSLYQAFQTYRRAVAGDPLHEELLRALREDGQAEESCQDECTTLEWDPEWIQAFETAMPFIERAIDEQRRFIESHEEIRRVDQARRTTVDSVRHLAEHSNLISRVQGDEIIPDKILIVQREDNYAIYENRFLYTLVLQMQDFLHRRYEKAREINGLRTLKAVSGRAARTGETRMRTRVTLEVEQRPGTTAAEDVPLEGMTDSDRVEYLMRRTWQLTSAPLMRQLKGCTLVTPPIVRTNVFKGNENFKQALNLYEFLQRYQKPGYEILRDEQALPGLPEGLRDNLYELQLLEAMFGRMAMDAEWAEGLEEARTLTEARIELQRQELELSQERETRSRVAQARREEDVIRRREIARREETISLQEEEIARQRGEISDRDLRLQEAAEENQKLTETVAEDQRILAETKEEAKRQLEQTVAEDQRILAETKEEAKRTLEQTVAEDQRILAETKEEAQRQMQELTAQGQREREAAKAEKARLEETLHQTQAEVLQAKSDIEAERLGRRQDLEQAKKEFLEARHQASEELSRVKKQSEDALQAAEKRAAAAEARIQKAEQEALKAQRQLREQKEKVSSLQKQLIQARQSAKKAESENKQGRTLRQVARKVWEGK